MKPRLIRDFHFPARPEELAFGVCTDAGVLTTANSGWRVFRPVLDASKCIRCLFCWVYCPDGVIGKEEKDLTIDYDYCKGCGVCAHECPKKAISMVKEGE
ncbi:2-ketoisovalerate ferredoxin oxidoreductase subunit delta [Synergistales bacterium]|nr:2-ketoisovalerate ferredoxin oxidoreductase subunit delta [Synergistales bacterium]